jgi:hypothetical protein
MHVRTGPAAVRLPDDTEARTATFIISTSARDSHGTVLNQRAWNLDRYQRNPIVGYQHAVWGGGLCNDPSPDMVIGTSRVAIEETRDAADARLIAVATFEPRDINELADKIWRKIQFGTLRATSVGFTEVGEGEWGDDDEARGRENATYYFAGQELYEWSVVNMGSNPETVKRDATARARVFVARAVAALRHLGEPVTVEDVMRMRVSEALVLLDGAPAAQALRDVTREEARQRVPEYIRRVLTS